MKKGFKMPSSYAVLMIIIALMAVLTWIVPAGTFQADKDGHLIAGTYEAVKSNPQGIYDVLMAPVRAMLGTSTVTAAIEVSFFIIMVGAFLGVVNETGALDVGIANVVKKYKGREKMLIPVLMFLFALGGTTYGMGEETMAFYPLIVPVMMAVGFDNVVGVSIVLLGSQIGCLASTVNPFATGVAAATAGVSVADGIIWRLLFFVVMLGMAIAFVYNYASKIEKDPTKSLTYANREADNEFFNVSDASTEVDTPEMTKEQKNVIRLFVLTFVIMIVSLIPWADLGVPYFADFNSWLVGLPVVGQIVGTSAAALGTWYFPEVTTLFIFMAVIIGFVTRMGEDKWISAFMAGAADLLGVAIVVAVARGIQVVMNDGQITATILHWGEEGLKGLSSQLFIILTYIFYLPMSFLIPSSSGLAGATMGIMAPLGQFAKVPVHLIITAYQSASGVLNLVTPTSGIVMGALALSRVELGTWWKFVGKLIVGIIVVTIAILVVATFF